MIDDIDIGARLEGSGWSRRRRSQALPKDSARGRFQMIGGSRLKELRSIARPVHTYHGDGPSFRQIRI